MLQEGSTSVPRGSPPPAVLEAFAKLGAQSREAARDAPKDLGFVAVTAILQIGTAASTAVGIALVSGVRIDLSTLLSPLFILWVAYDYFRIRRRWSVGL